MAGSSVPAVTHISGVRKGILPKLPPCGKVQLYAHHSRPCSGEMHDVESCHGLICDGYYRSGQ